jgi:hypothetical protein
MKKWIIMVRTLIWQRPNSMGRLEWPRSDEGGTSFGESSAMTKGREHEIVTAIGTAALEGELAAGSSEKAA